MINSGAPDTPIWLSFGVMGGRVLNIISRWVPGLKEGAPKRNLLLLLIYIELLLFGLPIIEHFI